MDQGDNESFSEYGREAGKPCVQATGCCRWEEILMSADVAAT